MTRNVNLNNIIPIPLKEVIGSIRTCLYESPYCTYSSADIATALVTAAIQNKSPNTVANRPDSDTVFERIYKGLNMDNLESLIKTQRPPKGTHIKLLLDGHNDGFWGKDALGIIRTKPKNGTNKAFGYLVGFSNIEPKGIVAIQELFSGSVTTDSMEMIEELRKDYTIELLIADGEFYKAEFVEYLTDAKIPFIIRRTNTGNIRELGIKYTKPHLYETIVERPTGEKIRLRYWIYRYKGIGDDFFLASNMKNGSKTIRKLFKTRWNIETGFREVNRVGIKTTTRDFLVRLFFYVVSCMVYNMWRKIRFRYSMFAVRLDDIVVQIKAYIKRLMLSASDILAVWRRRCIRLRII
jgi:putative transposase